MILSLSTTYYYTHSTKYLAGHTDLIGGCLSYSTAELGHKLHNTQILLGPSMVDGTSPFGCVMNNPSSLLVSNGCIPPTSQPEDTWIEDGASFE